jgi:pimeloyl-ACP methyl ester carboxylesterase
VIRTAHDDAEDALREERHVHLAYQAIGAGERDIVLVLDWASHLEAVWEQPFIREFIASLNRYARVLWFDMPGVGLSDRVVDPAVATEESMDDVRAVMNAAGSEQATLLAHGHGVQMALMAPATYPERIESLVLINGFARFSRADDYPAGVPESAAQALLTGIEETWGTGVMAGPLGPSVASRPGSKSGTDAWSALPRRPAPRSRRCGRSSTTSRARRNARANWATSAG